MIGLWRLISCFQMAKKNICHIPVIKSWLRKDAVYGKTEQNSIIGVSMQALVLFLKNNLYCCFCFWILRFHFNKTKYIEEIMPCKLKMYDGWRWLAGFLLAIFMSVEQSRLQFGIACNSWLKRLKSSDGLDANENSMFSQLQLKVHTWA